MTVWKDSAYKEPGWTVTDNFDSNLHDSVKVTGSVNVNVIGTYTLTYTVKDQAGLTATKTRTVKVEQYIPGIDTIPPVITLIGTGDTSIAVGSTWRDPGCTAFDNADGNITSKVTVREQNGKTITTVAPGSYTILYTVTDLAGHTTEVARILRVTGQSTDTTPPVIALKGCPVCTTNVGTQFTDPGVTVTDNIDVIPVDSVKRVVTNKATGAEFQYATFWRTVGVYNFTYRVYDKSGNPATPVVRQVTVKDTASPGNLLAKYGVPRATAIGTIQKTFTSVSTDGATAPNVSVIKDFRFAWRNEQYNIGFDEFSMHVDPNASYVNLKEKITQTFDKPSPAFTLTGSGITGLDGEYWVTGDATQFVWVKKDGSYAIIFK
jgi:hypothetical protein